MIAIAALNLMFLAAGAILLWGLGAFRTLGDALPLAGVAHLVGTAAVVLLSIQFAILGVGLAPALLASMGVVGAAGAAARMLVPGRRRVHGLSFPRPRVGRLAAVALPLVYVVLLLRLAPHLGVWEPDAVSTWTMRAKSLYFSDGLDVQTLRSAGAFAYPLFESMLQALDFVALGRADDLTFHVQFAIMLVSFATAVAGLSRSAGAPSYAIWPLLGLFLITPEVQSRGLSPLADLTLDYFFAVAALLLALWLESRRPWLLASASILLAAAISTKREGLLLAAVAFAAAMALAIRSGRRAVVTLGVAGLCALATFVPWRIWIALHGSSTDIGNLRASSLQLNSGQIGPAARLLGERTFAYGAWLLVVPLAIVLAVAAGALAGRAARRIAAFYGVASLLAFAGFIAIWWLVPDLQSAENQEQPAVRLAGALVALSAALAPLLAARSLTLAGVPGVDSDLPDDDVGMDGVRSGD